MHINRELGVGCLDSRCRPQLAAHVQTMVIKLPLTVALLRFGIVWEDYDYDNNVGNDDAKPRSKNKKKCHCDNTDLEPRDLSCLKIFEFGVYFVFMEQSRRNRDKKKEAAVRKDL